MDKRPNIIFYFSDQQRWDTCGCYGQKLDVTPNLDRMARRGALFTRAFTCQPVCGPARACLQTGKYATEVGCFKNGIALPLDVPTIAGYFADAGYDTAYVGKWHLASDHRLGVHCETSAVPEERRGGYRDYWMASDVLEFTSHGYNGYMYDSSGKKTEFIGYRADCVNAYAQEYVRSRQSERPFFLFVSQIEPHHQNDRNRYEGPDGSKRRFADYEVPGDLVGTEGDWRENYPDYLGCCNALDGCVGKLMDTLEERGILENTIVIYSSDHGSHFRTRNAEYKRACHDGCTHIPMIACGPGFDGAGEIDRLVSLIDVPATLLDCAGIAVPGEFRGHSLLRLAGGDEVGFPAEVFMQISESEIGRCVRTERWKYSVRAEGDGNAAAGADVYRETFLYDLERDPYERNNLVAEPECAVVRESLRRVLVRRMTEAGECAPTIVPA